MSQKFASGQKEPGSEILILHNREKNLPATSTDNRDKRNKIRIKLENKLVPVPTGMNKNTQMFLLPLFCSAKRLKFLSHI